MQIPDHARDVVERLERYGYEAYVVGGCVRDSLLGREPKDWDVCTSALPEEVLRVFRRFHVIKTGLQHGTLTVMSEHRPVEVTTFRTDGSYSDGRHPDSVSFVPRIEEDLARRDFTINAMAYNPARGLIDLYGGQDDLRAGLIRCVGEPDARFHEDGLRLLRALRFAARYGFAPERETGYALRRNRHLLEHISAERILSELRGILEGRDVLSMLLGFPELFTAVIPELEPCIGAPQNSPYHCYDVWTHSAHAVQAAPADIILRLTLLLHDIAKPACRSTDAAGIDHFHGHPEQGAQLADRILRRLKSDNDTRRDVVTLIREHDRALPQDLPAMRRLIGKLGLLNTQRLLEVQRADLAAHAPEHRESWAADLRRAQALLAEVQDEPPAFSVGDLAIGGRELLQMGLAPGPGIRRLLEQLLREVQDEQLTNSPEALSTRARQLLTTPQA